MKLTANQLKLYIYKFCIYTHILARQANNKRIVVVCVCVCIAYLPHRIELCVELCCRQRNHSSELKRNTKIYTNSAGYFYREFREETSMEIVNINKKIKKKYMFQITNRVRNLHEYLRKKKQYHN